MGWACVTLAGLFKPLGPGSRIVARLGPLPDISRNDVAVTIPLAVLGFALVVSCEPRRPIAHRLAAVALVLGAVVWVTSEFPWNDPLVPFLQSRSHGVHWLDLLALAPVGIAVRLLRPIGSGRVAAA